MTGNNDEILIEGIKNQNDKVIAELYDQFFPSVRHYIYRNNGNTEDARDIFNDAVIVVFEKARDNTLKLNCSLKTYIYAICRNLWFKKLKADKGEMINYEEVEDTLLCASLAEEDLFNIDEARMLYQKHLVRMSETCRRLLTYFLEGRSFREISAEMNFENENYARKRKYRCVKLLVKRIMSDPDYKKISYDDEN
jgi:RNA polymerase sigma factor (sigma-70 family)